MKETDKIKFFRGTTRLDLNPDIVLANTKGKLKKFVIAGYDHEGKEYFASTFADTAKSIRLLQRFSLMLVDNGNDYEE